MRRDGHETEKQRQVPEEEACVFEEDQGAEEAKQAYRQNKLGMAWGMTLDMTSGMTLGMALDMAWSMAWSMALDMARFRQHVALACHLFFQHYGCQIGPDAAYDQCEQACYSCACIEDKISRQQADIAISCRYKKI